MEAPGSVGAYGQHVAIVAHSDVAIPQHRAGPLGLDQLLEHRGQPLAEGADFFPQPGQFGAGVIFEFAGGADLPLDGADHGLQVGEASPLAGECRIVGRIELPHCSGDLPRNDQQPDHLVDGLARQALALDLQHLEQRHGIGHLAQRQRAEAGLAQTHRFDLLLHHQHLIGLLDRRESQGPTSPHRSAHLPSKNLGQLAPLESLEALPVNSHRHLPLPLPVDDARPAAGIAGPRRRRSRQWRSRRSSAGRREHPAPRWPAGKPPR